MGAAGCVRYNGERSRKSEVGMFAPNTLPVSVEMLRALCLHESYAASAHHKQLLRSARHVPVIGLLSLASARLQMLERQREKHVESVRKLILARMQGQACALCFEAWRNEARKHIRWRRSAQAVFTWHVRLVLRTWHVVHRRHVLMRKALRWFHNRLLLAAFGRWMECYQAEARAKLVTMRVVRRWMHSKLASAVHLWRENASRAKIVRRFVHQEERSQKEKEAVRSEVMEQMTSVARDETRDLIGKLVQQLKGERERRRELDLQLTMLKQDLALQKDTGAIGGSNHEERAVIHAMSQRLGEWKQRAERAELLCGDRNVAAFGSISAELEHERRRTDSLRQLLAVVIRRPDVTGEIRALIAHLVQEGSAGSGA